MRDDGGFEAQDGRNATSASAPAALILRRIKSERDDCLPCGILCDTHGVALATGELLQ
jgi:hypothetical protein